VEGERRRLGVGTGRARLEESWEGWKGVERDGVS